MLWSADALQALQLLHRQAAGQQDVLVHASQLVDVAKPVDDQAWPEAVHILLVLVLAQLPAAASSACVVAESSSSISSRSLPVHKVAAKGRFAVDPEDHLLPAQHGHLHVTTT